MKSLDYLYKYIHLGNDLHIFKHVVYLLNYFTAVFLLGLCLLNLVNPSTLPPLRCSGSVIDEPRISHKFHGDTVTTLNLFTVVLLVPYLQVIVH